MRLANGLVAFDFDPQTGSLIGIENLRTGLSCLSNLAQGRLFRLFVPDAENWIDRYADSHTAGRPEITLSGDTLKIRYANVVMADGSFSGIDAIVRITLPAGDDEARFRIELTNHGRLPVCEVIFPWVGGWNGFAGERGLILCGTHWAFDPFTSLRRNDGWNLLNSTRKHQIGFPHVNIPLCDVSNGQVGLSYNFYPTQPDLNFDLFIMDLNEHYGEVQPSFGWVQRPFVQAEGHWESGVVGISPHSGDWHHAADKMRLWLATWWRAPALPASLSGAIGFQNVYFREFTGREIRPISSLPGLSRHGREHGLNHIIVWDMPLLGMYLSAGSRDLFEDKPERIVQLKQALHEVRRMGVYASPLINMRLSTQAHPFWKEHGEKWAIRSMYGMPAQETLPLRGNTSALINRYLDQGGVRLCQSSPEFQGWALENTRKVLDLGFNAIFIDQPFSEDYCFSDQHNHPVPVPGHTGVCSWIARAAALVHQKHPDSYVIGEVPDIWNTQFFELWWFWDWSWLRPEVFRYVLPESLQSWVIDAYDHEHQVGRAFALGFLLNINVRSLEKTLPEVPQFAERIKQLAALRRKTYPCTLAGRFLGDLGLQVDTDAEITAAFYDAGEKAGIVLGEGSQRQTGGGSAKLKLDLTRLGKRPPAEVIIHRQDGSSQRLTPAIKGDSLIIETEIGRWEAAVVEIDRA